MTVYRALIVDDEPLARKRIEAMLRLHEDFEIVGQCGDGIQAPEMIGRHQPDVVFLDIQMPGADGLAVAQAIRNEQITNRDRDIAFIFVTAFSEHAVKAFEVQALDYLLKPFDQGRFDATLSRARQRLSSAQIPALDLDERIRQALSQLNPSYADRLLIKHEERIQFLKVENVDWIEAADKYVKIHSGQQVYRMRESLQSVEARLDPTQFARIHRSTLVNLDRIESLEPQFHGDYRVQLIDGTQLTLSRGYRNELRGRFGKTI